MRIAFCGYNWIGCRCLQLLIDAGHEVCVFTHDEPHYVNSVKTYATELGLEPETSPISPALLPFVPDVICSVYYREIINDEVLRLVDGKAFNLHPSLLPKYRGCGSLTWAIINGETEVGYTYHYMTPEVDKGNLLLQRRLGIEPYDTQATLYHRLMFHAAGDFLEALTLVEAGAHGVAQDHSAGSYYKRGCPHNGQIDPSWTREKIKRFIRAMTYPPLPPASLDGSEIRSIQEYDRRSE